LRAFDSNRRWSCVNPRVSYVDSQPQSVFEKIGIAFLRACGERVSRGDRAEEREDIEFADPLRWDVDRAVDDELFDLLQIGRASKRV
jgi:hypothetical protein